MNKELLFNLYSVHSPSGREKKMRKFIKRYIRRECGDVDIVQDTNGNLLCTKGTADTYPCLASHMDQVQDFHSKDFTIVEGGGAVFAFSPKTRKHQGLGADDKNGIYICLECLKKYDTLKVAFFVGEETGCVGSRAVDLSFFADCRFIIQPDRRGHSDLITSMFCGDVCSKDFISAIGADAYGYTPEKGSITDVGELVERGVGISCLNLSCGYYEAHTDREYTVLSDLENCLDFVQHIIETCTDVYPFEYVDRWAGYRSKYASYGSYESYGRSSRAKSKSYLSWWDDDEYYTDGYYESDESMMDELVRLNPQLTFDEIVNDYAMNFYTRDRDVLAELYEAATYVEDNYWHGFDDDDDVTPCDIRPLKVS